MEYSFVEPLLELAIAIQQIAAPPFQEGRRAVFMQQRFLHEGLLDVSIDDIGNVYGRLPGEGKAHPLVVSAHLDTVFAESTSLALRRERESIHGAGIGDNALGLAGLIGLSWILKQKGGGRCNLPGDVWLVANVGEEGLGNLRGMRAVVDRFGNRVKAYLVVEGMSLGQVYHRGLGVWRCRITAKTQGGHSWINYGRPSAIHELAGLVTRLAALTVPEKPRSSLNVGVISGGTSVNTIAPEASLELDLRSERKETLEELIEKVCILVETANRPDVCYSLEVLGERPTGGLPASHPLVQLASRYLLEQSITPNLTIGSTDASLPLSRGLPAICLGISTGAEAHTVNEYIHIPPIRF